LVPRWQLLAILTAWMFACGAGNASAQTTFSNSTLIASGPSAAASPYPSTITVSGLTGAVSNVTVTLNNLTHASVGDLGLLLVSPSGASLLIQGEMGGSNVMNNVTYTLSDAGASALPTNSAWAAGTYKPTASAAPSFLSPAPMSYNASAPAGASTFASTFNGTAPNGSWNLYVQSFGANILGFFTGGWSVTITTAPPPSVTNVSSTALNGAYDVGGVIPITIQFTAAVNVTGTPQLALNSGGTASYSSGSGTDTLTFSYTVAAGQNSADLDYTSTTALSLNGGTIKDASNTNAVLTLPAPGAAGSLGANKAIVIDTTAPSVTDVSSTTTNGTYGVGAVISITVDFNKSVTVTGTPQLALNSGGTASYSSGSGTNTLTFTYTVAAGQNSADLDYTSTSALSLNGGTITGASGNAILTLPAPGATGSLGANKDIVIDTTSPTVTGVSSTNGNGTYGTGAVISITIGFSTSVNVTGTPQLALNSGGTASYSSGSGTGTLTFSYTVGAGQNSALLDYTSTAALSLNGGTIKDASNNSANLTLPAPGATGSLGANKSIVIDTTSPTVVSFKVLFGTQSYDVIGSARNRLPWQITGIQVVFSKVIATGNVNSLTGVTTTGFSGLGTNTLTWTINPISVASVSAVLKGTGADALKDAAGNALGGGSDFTQNFKVLLGDFNDDGVVNSPDTVSVYGATAQPYNILADLNGDGVVNINDVNLARSRLGTAQP